MTARARRLPFLFSETVRCQMVIYPEQDSGRGAGSEGIQREAWMVMDAISFHIPHALKIQIVLLKP